MNIPIEIIAPSHGCIWRDDPMQIVMKYYVWSQDYEEDQITVSGGDKMQKYGDALFSLGDSLLIDEALM